LSASSSRRGEGSIAPTYASPGGPVLDVGTGSALDTGYQGSEGAGHAERDLRPLPASAARDPEASEGA
jgi:hypothetical protein